MMPFAITLPLLTTNLLFCETNDDLCKKNDRIVEKTWTQQTMWMEKIMWFFKQKNDEKK